MSSESVQNTNIYSRASVLLQAAWNFVSLTGPVPSTKMCCSVVMRVYLHLVSIEVLNDGKRSSAFEVDRNVFEQSALQTTFIAYETTGLVCGSSMKSKGLEQRSMLVRCPGNPSDCGTEMIGHS
jgi:predicted branched-subunit amino acid permease